MRALLFCILVITVFGFVPSAHAALYYEFNPDYSQSLLVASSGTISEVFLPLNEFLGGFDFWVSNNSQSGSVTFTFLNSSGTQLAQQTVTVPAIADDTSGTRFHVNLPAQLAVNGTATYSIQISTAVPTFRLYYADQNTIVPHNGVPAQAYSSGVARINGEDMGFSFKFALYENSETIPPVISNTTTSQIAIDQVVLSFNANEPVDYKVQYNNQLVNWTGSYTACLATIEVCIAYLPVSPSVTYDYTLTVKDAWGNQSTFTGIFTSMAYGQTPTPTPTSTPTLSATPTPTPTATPTPDAIPPVITNARAVNLTPTSAGFAWTTNEAANSTVVVQLTPVLITAGGNSDATLELEHLVVVGGLTADTYYQATITSADASNNSTATTVTFLTPQNTPPPPPNPSSTPTPTPNPNGTPTPTPTVVASGSGDDSEVSWTPPASGEPSSGYRVDVFDSNNNLIKTIIVPAGTNKASLKGLPPGDHRVVVYANNDGVYEKVAAPTKATVRKKSLLEQLLSKILYILGGFVLAIALAIGAMVKFRKPETPTPQMPSTPVAPPSTAPPTSMV